VVNRASLVFAVIQASGGYALAGAASAALNTRTNMLDCIHEVLYMILLLKEGPFLLGCRRGRGGKRTAEKK
jgi:hypothetical protein